MEPTVGIIHYRVLRRVLPLAVIGTEVQVAAHWIVEWEHGSNDRNHRRVLVITGTLKEKAVSYQVEWKFPIDRETAQSIQTGIYLLSEALAESQSGREPPLEKEIFVLPVPWLRMGAQYKDGKFDRCYAEFSKDGSTLRAPVENLPALVNLRELVG